MTDTERDYLERHGWWADANERNPFIWRHERVQGLLTTSSAMRKQAEWEAEDAAQERVAA